MNKVDSNLSTAREEIGLNSKSERDAFAKNFFSIVSNRVSPEMYEKEKQGIPPILVLAKPEEKSLLKSIRREIEEGKQRGKIKIENELLRNMNHQQITPHSIEFEKELMGFAKNEVVGILNQLQRMNNQRKIEKEREVNEYEALKNNPFDI